MWNADKKEVLFERLRRDEEYIQICAAAGHLPSALMLYGKVTGIAETMEALGMINSENKEKIIKRAWGKYMGKDVRA